MRVIADTSVWIDYLKGRNPCHAGLSELLENDSVLAVEVVFAELLQGARDGREAAIIGDLWDLLPKHPENGLFLKAGWESSKNRWMTRGVGLIDAVIVVTARATKSRVWTLDKKLLSILSGEEIFRSA